MSKSIVVNGFQITETVAEVLGNWNENNAPERYATYLSEIQDVLCRMLIDNDDFDSQIKESLINLICIKDDLKKLSLVEGGQS